LRGWARLGILLLGDAIQAVRIQNQVLGEAVVEQAKPAAQYGFRRALSSSANAPGKAEPGRPVAMIVNGVLRFKAQSAAEGEIGTNLPVILHVQPGIHHGDRHCGHRAAGRLIERKLRRSLDLGARAARRQSLHRRGVVRDAGESERAIESGARSIDFVNRPQTPAEFHKMIAMRNRSVVLQFVVILAVVLHARSTLIDAPVVNPGGSSCKGVVTGV